MQLQKSWRIYTTYKVLLLCLSKSPKLYFIKVLLLLPPLLVCLGFGPSVLRDYILLFIDQSFSVQYFSPQFFLVQLSVFLCLSLLFNLVSSLLFPVCLGLVSVHPPQHLLYLVFHCLHVGLPQSVSSLQLHVKFIVSNLFIF